MHTAGAVCMRLNNNEGEAAAAHLLFRVFGCVLLPTVLLRLQQLLHLLLRLLLPLPLRQLLQPLHQLLQQQLLQQLLQLLLQISAVHADALQLRRPRSPWQLLLGFNQTVERHIAATNLALKLLNRGVHPHAACGFGAACMRSRGRSSRGLSTNSKPSHLECMHAARRLGSCSYTYRQTHIGLLLATASHTTHS